MKAGIHRIIIPKHAFSHAFYPMISDDCTESEVEVKASLTESWRVSSSDSFTPFFITFPSTKPGMQCAPLRICCVITSSRKNPEDVEASQHVSSAQLYPKLLHQVAKPAARAARHLASCPAFRIAIEDETDGRNLREPSDRRSHGGS